MLNCKKIFECVAIILVFVAASYGSNNVLLNSGFEIGDGNNANNWTRVDPNQVQRTNEDSYEGDWSIKCIDVVNEANEAYVWQAESGHNLNWTAGETITTSVYAKGLLNDPETERVLVKLYLYDENLTPLGSQSYWRSSYSVYPGGWTRITGKYVIPDGITIGSVTLQLHYCLLDKNGKGYVFFDDASVERTVNVIANPSFEFDSGTDWDADDWAEHDPPRAARTNEDAREGDWSMKLYDDGSSDWAYALSFRAPIARYEVNEVIEPSIYVKGSIGLYPDEYVFLEFVAWDSNDNLVGQSYRYLDSNDISDTEWTQYSVPYQVPAGKDVAQMSLQVQLMSDKDGSGYVFFDDAFLPYRGYELVGDLNGDWRVDFKDFALLAANWMKEAE